MVRVISFRGVGRVGALPAGDRSGSRNGALPPGAAGGRSPQRWVGGSWAECSAGGDRVGASGDIGGKTATLARSSSGRRAGGGDPTDSAPCREGVPGPVGP